MDPNSNHLKYNIPSWASSISSIKGRECKNIWRMEIIKSGSIIQVIEISDLLSKKPSEKGYLTVGRLPTCDIVLDHASISRNHAIFQYRASDEKLFLYDLNSTHGTFVNKIRIPPEKYLDLLPGSLIKFGESTRLYVIECKSTVETPTLTESDESKNSSSAQAVPVEKNYKQVLETFLRKNDGFSFKFSIDTEGQLFQASVQIENPINLSEPLVGYGIGESKAEAEREASIDACIKLGESGVIIPEFDYSSSHSHYQHENDDFEDEYYDRTEKKGKRKFKEDVESAPQNLQTLSAKRKAIINSIKNAEKELIELEGKNEADCNSTQESEDYLDKYMDSIGKSLGKDSLIKKRKLIDEMVEELRRVEKLLRIVTGGSLPDLEEGKTDSLPSDSVIGNKLHSESDDLRSKTQQATKQKRSRVYTVAMPPSTQQYNSYGSIDPNNDDNWNPPVEQAGDGKTELNERLGY